MAKNDFDLNKANEQYEHAVALLDFCGGDLSTEYTQMYFERNAPEVIKSDRNRIMLTALSLQRDGE